MRTVTLLFALGLVGAACGPTNVDEPYGAWAIGLWHHREACADQRLPCEFVTDAEMIDVREGGEVVVLSVGRCSEGGGGVVDELEWRPTDAETLELEPPEGEDSFHLQSATRTEPVSFHHEDDCTATTDTGTNGTKWYRGQVSLTPYGDGCDGQLSALDDEARACANPS